jgi:hypothetical protein
LAATEEEGTLAKGAFGPLGSGRSASKKQIVMITIFLSSRSPEERKVAAERSIRAAIGLIKAGKLVYGDWERDCLVRAIGAAHRGLYDLAQVEARTALTPIAERTKPWKAPVYVPLTLEELEQSLRIVEGSPVRREPILNWLLARRGKREKIVRASSLGEAEKQ